ncbi:MAG: hypothetical protein CM1200mP18_22930 [Gammaproteobacteria bacterium]|nr:MAG: hypothetical protein CM1200mP18_22930 [Gammaproteobacteria bacterium]
MFEPGDFKFEQSVIYHARRPFMMMRLGINEMMRIWFAPGTGLPEDHAPLWRIVEADSLRGVLLWSLRTKTAELSGVNRTLSELAVVPVVGVRGVAR